jgi:uncharacterized RDD family membrane protein YckC
MATAAALAITYPTTDKIGFWRRVGATLIDGVIVGIVSTIVNSVLFGNNALNGNGFSFLLGLGYYLYFWSSYGHGQTLGKRVMSIRVVKTDGSELTLVDALIRYVGLLVSFFCLFLGVIWVAIDPNKQGWHDKIAKTYVVKA